MNSLIVSLRFHPGHFSHLAANYRLLADCGYTPHLYVNRSFNRMDSNTEFRKINNSGELPGLKTIDLAVFWFPSLQNILEIIRLRTKFGAKIVYVYHEPFDSILNYLRSGFGFKKVAKICLIHLANIPVLLLSHKVVLPSQSSFKLYKSKYAYLNRDYSCIPLLFADEAGSFLDEAGAAAKKYISYIGTIAADHAFDKFVDFLDASLKNKWFPDQVFLIATSSALSKRDKDRLDPYLSSGLVVISEGRPMTNEEINGYYRDSIVVWNAYNRSMQSGVLPKAYMFGAAVIVSAGNNSEFLDNQATGVLVADNGNALELKAAVEEIIRRRDQYFSNCRAKFLSTFYYKSNIERFQSMLNNNLTAEGV